MRAVGVGKRSAPSMKTAQKTDRSHLSETPRTDQLVHESQIRMIPFQVSYFHLLELTRELEREVNRLREARKRGNNKQVNPRKKSEAGSFRSQGKKNRSAA